MELCIKRNLLSFRLIRSELARLLETGRIEQTIDFSLDGSSHFTYALIHEDSFGTAALEYRTGEILIVLPTQQLDTLLRTDRAGIYAEIDLGTRGSLQLLIEKDSICLDLSVRDHLARKLHQEKSRQP